MPSSTDPVQEVSIVEPSERPPTSAPQAAIICIASATLIFTVCGINFAFGVYQNLYQQMSADSSSPFFGASPAMIDLIGTVSISLMTLGAPFIIAWAKRWSPRLVVWTGGLIFSLGLLLASFSTHMWQFQFTQGLLCGIGTCMCYMPAVTVIPMWFSSRRGLAIGIVSSGTGIGGLVWAPLLNAMIEHVGFRNTLRISSAIAFALIIPAGSVLKWDSGTLRDLRAVPLSSSCFAGFLNLPLFDRSVIRSRKFFSSALGAALQSAAYYTPVFFFASYASTLGYSSATASNFIAISNAANAIGKIAIGHAADKLGRINTLLITTGISAVAAFGLWLPSSISKSLADSQNLFIAFTILYGLFASAYISLFPASLIELFGVQRFSSVNGILYMIRGISTLIGTPVAGALIRHSSRQLDPSNFLNASILVGTLLTTASAAVFWVRFEASHGGPVARMYRWRL